ncbi:hypothetical protein BKA65DRAFT_551344 [Rhexocercosporidium sp. MPI-PUGE-AT-0058]|nr:hypothetical protein BKA65DRAFT_551344 [Rhexocercosporidium sp. MPI-PUGE-AT-0058]
MSSLGVATSRAQKYLESSTSSSPIEENLNLPAYAQNVLEDVDLPVLVLISHGHAPPLNPHPQLRFDVRSLANPPKHIRDNLNGTSWRLQEWMLSDPKFGERRDAIRKEIEKEMNRMTAENDKEDALKLGQYTDKIRQDVDWGLEKKQREKYAKELASEDQSGEEESIPQDVDTYSEATDQDNYSTLRVGIFCAIGRHRSVAMVEELAKMSWPGWQIKVEHRDLNKKRGSRKKPGGKDSRGTRGGGIPSYLEGD